MFRNKLTRLYCLMLAMLFIAATQLSAQPTDFPEISTLTPQTLFGSMIEPMYSVLVIVFGYLSGYIPGIKTWAPFYRVIAFALVAGLGFHLFGVSIGKIALTYLLSSGLYAIILKNVLPSKKAEPAAG